MVDALAQQDTVTVDLGLVSSGTVWIDPLYQPQRPEYHYYWPSIQWLPAPRDIRDFTDAELVAEIKRRKADRTALDQVEIKEGK